MEILDGKKIAAKKLLLLKKDIQDNNVEPTLAVILVGDDKASRLYVKLKEETAKEIGIELRKYLFAKNAEQEEILACIDFLNNDLGTDGIIVQLPLPEELDTDMIIGAIDPRKDVDGFHEDNIVAFIDHEEEMWPVFPHALMILLESAAMDLTGKTASLIVNSQKFGSVLAAACDRYNIMSHIIIYQQRKCQQAQILASDIIITACGVPGTVTGSYIKKNAIIIDGGISTQNNKTVGDVDVTSVTEKASYLSLVPGGVGPVTIACLLENVLALNKRKQ